MLTPSYPASTSARYFSSYPDSLRLPLPRNCRLPRILLRLELRMPEIASDALVQLFLQSHHRILTPGLTERPIHWGSYRFVGPAGSNGMHSSMAEATSSMDEKPTWMRYNICCDTIWVSRFLNKVAQYSVKYPWFLQTHGNMTSRSKSLVLSIHCPRPGHVLLHSLPIPALSLHLL